MPLTSGVLGHEFPIATNCWRVGPQTYYCQRPVASWTTNFLLPPTSGNLDHKLPIATNQWPVEPQTSYCHRPVANWTTNFLLPPTGGELDHRETSNTYCHLPCTDWWGIGPQLPTHIIAKNASLT